MGCDIHTLAEKKIDGQWVRVPFAPFDWRQYAMFAVLVGVRNYDEVKPMSELRGLPDDFVCEPYEIGDHSFSWLSVDELEKYDYAQPYGNTNESLRDVLGAKFFDDIQQLRMLGAERVVFGFDS